MSQRGIEVNPALVRPNDSIAIQHRKSIDKKTGAETIIVTKSRKISTAGFCPSKPECVHLDHECYDTRYSTVIQTV